ncbi:MAG: sugar transferase [Acidobacteriaceae bacterium]|nr:sugar transferase [Acidobacteriaceae bacterium]
MGANLGVTSVFGQQAVKGDERPASLNGLSAARKPSASQSFVNSVLMMATDVGAVIGALYLALHLHIGNAGASWSGLHHAIAVGPAMLVQLGYFVWFITVLLVLGWHDGLYGRLQSDSVLHEQRMTVQACLNAGLLLCGTMYMSHDSMTPRAVVLSLVCFSTALLCLLRGFWRYSSHRDFQKGIGTKNVLILGTGHVGDALKRQIFKHRRLGRNFKGFVELPGEAAGNGTSSEVIGTLYQLRHLVRQHFVDEIIIAGSCSTLQVLEVVEMAADMHLEVLAIPGVFEDMAPDSQIFYFGDFPVTTIHRRDDRALALLLKRAVDIVLSSIFLLALAPVFLVIGILIKLNSPGPAFYVSERIGKKGRVFRLWKFRTMKVGADRMKAALASANERDGILFKIKDDPRVTPVGRFLRKFSLDELPQLFNVLWGDMSLVGPRPPLANEVARYEVKHYRRLDVLPGLTGLWQVRARHDPSFDQYVALDIAYVENWNFWMDLKILVRTAEVVLRGTGS